MQHLFEKKDYHYCLFIGHLVLEKILKAIYIDRVGKSPPYKHGLLKLANLAGIKLTADQEAFLDEATGFNIAARYPDYKFDFYKKCTRAYTKPRVQKILEFYRWAKEMTKSD